MASIFTKIIAGELPCYKIYEDDHVLSFLTIAPIQLGHTLVVPKVEIDHVMDLEEPHYSAMFKAAKPISRAIYKATGCKRVGTAIQGFEVPHVHYHLIPMFDPSDFNFAKAKQRENEEMLGIQEKIVANLSVH